MKLIIKHTLHVLTAVLALGACSTKNLSQQKSKTTSLEQVSDLFLNTSEIIGGEKLSPVHVVSSHIVALYDTVESTICTGSIIAEDIILTAGHCIGASENMVILFGVDAENYVDFRSVQFAGAHINFGPKEKGDWSDIGLVYFSEGLPAGFTPVPILNDELLLQKGVETELAGYGQSDGVNKTGSGYLRHTTVQVEDPSFAFGEVELNQTQGKGACHGDSGGPAYVVEDSQIKLWGITSRSEKDDDDNCSQYSVYTSATAYANWINSSLNAIHEAAQKMNAEAASEGTQNTEVNTLDSGQRVRLASTEVKNKSVFTVASSLQLFR